MYGGHRLALACLPVSSFCLTFFFSPSLLLSLSFLFLRQDLPWTQNHWLSRLTEQWAPEVCLFSPTPLPALGLQILIGMPGGLVWAQGAALGSLCSSRHFPGSSPQPPIIVLKAKIRMKWIGLEGNMVVFSFSALLSLPILGLFLLL